MHPYLSPFMSVNYLKITLCAKIACDPFRFLEQVHGEKRAVGLYLKIITVFQDFSYLFLWDTCSTG